MSLKLALKRSSPPTAPEGKQELDIPAPLRSWGESYAEKKHTTLSQLLTNFLVELKKSEEEGDGVQQI